MVEGQDFYLSVTVTIKMTPEQRDGYAEEYGEDNVPADVRGRIANDVGCVLGTAYWMREFTSYSVSDPS